MNKSKNSIRIYSFGLALLFSFISGTGNFFNAVFHVGDSVNPVSVKQVSSAKQNWLGRINISKEYRKEYRQVFQKYTAALSEKHSRIIGLVEGATEQNNNWLSTDGLEPPIGGLAGKLIEVNLTRQTFTCWQNGKVWGHFLTSTGRPDMVTRTGNFKVFEHDPMAWAPMAKCWMPWFLGFYRSGSLINGIHELPLYGGVQEPLSHLGHPVSHGCVRLAPGVAKSVYDWAVNGTPVYVHY